MALKMTKIRKVHQRRKTERTERPMVTMASPMYHQALRPGTMYSSACQEISCFLFAIRLLYHKFKKTGKCATMFVMEGYPSG